STRPPEPAARPPLGTLSAAAQPDRVEPSQCSACCVARWQCRACGQCETPDEVQAATWRFLSTASRGAFLRRQIRDTLALKPRVDASNQAYRAPVQKPVFSGLACRKVKSGECHSCQEPISGTLVEENRCRFLL